MCHTLYPFCSHAMCTLLEQIILAFAGQKKKQINAVANVFLLLFLYFSSSRILFWWEISYCSKFFTRVHLKMKRISFPRRKQFTIFRFCLCKKVLISMQFDKSIRCSYTYTVYKYVWLVLLRFNFNSIPFHSINAVSISVCIFVPLL